MDYKKVNNNHSTGFIKNKSLRTMARLYLHHKQYQAAASLYKQAFGENNYQLRSSQNYRYAHALFKNREFVLALEQIDEAINKSERAKYLSLRGEIYIKLSRLAKAENELQRSIEINDRQAFTYYLLGIALVLQKKWHLAREALLTARELGYDAPKFHHRLGQAHFEMGKFADAKAAFSRAAKTWTDEIESSLTASELYYMAGLSSEKIGEMKDSQAFYNHAIMYDEKFNSQKLGIGIFHQNNHEYELAKQAYIETNTAEALFRIGNLHEMTGETGKAIAVYKDVLKVDQTHSEYHFRLGACHESTGDDDAAATYYRQAIARCNNYNHEWYLKLLEALKACGSEETYKQVLNEATLLADVAHNAYRKGTHKMPRRMRYHVFYENFQVDEKTILFESMSGNRVSGNPLAIFRYMLQDDRFKDCTFIWTINNNDIIPDRYKHLPNVLFIKRFTDLFYKHLASAKVLVNNVTFPDFFIPRDEQIYLNTWHGTPWKKLGYDVNKAKMDYANTARNFLHATHLIVPNLYTYNQQKSSYQVTSIHPGETAVTGYPRIDMTYETMQNPGVIKEELNINDNQKVILYAPTWRGEKSFVFFDRQRLEQDLERLSRLGAHILFRGHHLAENLLQDIDISNITIVPSEYDTNEILGIVDLLITDYSSVFFDFLVTDKPIVHYVYDYDDYVTERGLYFGLDELPGDVAESSDEMIGKVQNHIHMDYQPTQHYLEAKNAYVYKDDGQVTERVIDWAIFDKDHVETLPNTNTKEKILFHGGSFQPNGITSAFINLVKGIDKHLYDITVTVSDSIIHHPERMEQLMRVEQYVNVIPKTGGINRSDEGEMANEIIGKRNFPAKAFQIYQEDYQREFKRLFGNVHFNYLIDYSGYSFYYNQLLVSNPNHDARNVVYVHNDIYSEYISRYPDLRIIFEQYKQYDAVLSVSEPTSQLNIDNLSETYNIPREKFDFIENVQDPSAVLEKATLPLDGKDEHLFIDGETTFITLGRLSDEKDHEKLIRSFHKVHQSNQKTRLFIIGDGPLKYKLQTVIDELGLKKSVHLLGRKTNPFPYLSQADCFVLSSNYEGQPVVLYEAMTLDMPIIATDIISNRGILEDGYGELAHNSINGLEKAMNDYINGNVRFKQFDIKAYNRRAIDVFHQKALNEK